jgi:hypothetical protein
VSKRRSAAKGDMAPVKIGDYLLVPKLMAPSYCGLHDELLRESRQLQPWRPNDSVSDRLRSMKRRTVSLRRVRAIR